MLDWHRGQLTENALLVAKRWQDEQTIVIARALLAFEVTSTLRRMVLLGEITDDDGDEAFQAYQQFWIRLSHRKAIFTLAWTLARDFDRPRAYDAI